MDRQGDTFEHEAVRLAGSGLQKETSGVNVLADAMCAGWLRSVLFRGSCRICGGQADECSGRTTTTCW